VPDPATVNVVVPGSVAPAPFVMPRNPRVVVSGCGAIPERLFIATVFVFVSNSIEKVETVAAVCPM
jgi:hypothetical protein